MIVASLEIENYKQYAGPHRIEFPEQGIVAVTGPNGAGKTTLFEAIEWCLYCPRAIPQATVPPHDGVGRTVVRVTLEDPADGKRYCIQRELRSGGTQAEIFLEDDPGQPLVQGTREVSRYVARHLIGLPHGAFVSTFFTKQKELQFFGDRSATERRTEVGRLLGLEAVREAQKEIGEGRTAARSSAELLRGEYTRRLGERDLNVEIANAQQALKDAEAREVEVEQGALRAAADAEQARVELERLRDLQSQDATLGHEMAELAGALAAAGARRDGAVDQLKRLEQRAAERMRLAETASKIDELTADVTRLEEERDRARKLVALRDAHDAAGERVSAVKCRLEKLVAEHRESADGLDGWVWTAEDAMDPAAATRRLYAVVSTVDPRESRNRVEHLQKALQISTVVGEFAATLVKYHRQREKLTSQRDALLAPGDPATTQDQALLAVREVRQAEHVARSAIAAARVEREEDERLAASLRLRGEEPICPTCTRPLGAQEAERLASLLDAKIAKLIEEERILTESAQAAAEQVEAAEQVSTEARSRQEALRSLDDRLADGQRMIEEAEERHAQETAALQSVMETIGVSSIPSLEAIDEARLSAERTQQFAGLRGVLERLADDAGSSRESQSDAAKAISELADVSYDAGEHKVAAEALKAARHAAAQVEQIDIELANQVVYEQQRTHEARVIAELDAKKAAIAAQRQALAFDVALLRTVLEIEQSARIAAHEAREHHAAARHAVRDAREARDRVIAERDQLQQLIEDADQKTREADDLTRMYEEFGEFDRYVARHVGPLLAETTERMLSQVTNGKFDHVQFDENYGIEVFDGDEAFPLGGFSGGERDVVALCARLALSEVVGSAALRPPRFLVLDEVFGSLDDERRSQLLETLGSLAYSGHFRQMFIISHVDDVQQSPVMSEAWTVEERDGVSRVVRPEVPVLAPA